MGTTAILEELRQSINSGEIFSLPRERLELFVAALTHSQAYTLFGASEFPRVCETARLALSIRVSEDSNLQSRRESRTALIISVVALLAGIVQAGASIWQLASHLPIEVQASTPLPIRAASTIPVYVVPAAPTQQTPVAPALRTPKQVAP